MLGEKNPQRSGTKKRHSNFGVSFFFINISILHKVSFLLLRFHSLNRFAIYRSSLAQKTVTGYKLKYLYYVTISSKTQYRYINGLCLQSAISIQVCKYFLPKSLANQYQIRYYNQPTQRGSLKPSSDINSSASVIFYSLLYTVGNAGEQPTNKAYSL